MRVIHLFFSLQLKLKQNRIEAEFTDWLKTSRRRYQRPLLWTVEARRSIHPPMRTQSDRLRHTLLFELIGLITVTPIAAWLLDREMVTIGTMSITISVTAMICNYLFNLGFDHALKFLGRPIHIRSAKLRFLHAILFESSLLVVTLPFVAWWLDMTLWKAFLTDIGFALFFLVYAYAFNWAYDRIFPMPVTESAPLEAR